VKKIQDRGKNQEHTTSKDRKTKDITSSLLTVGRVIKEETNIENSGEALQSKKPHQKKKTRERGNHLLQTLHKSKKKPGTREEDTIIALGLLVSTGGSMAGAWHKNLNFFRAGGGRLGEK